MPIRLKPRSFRSAAARWQAVLARDPSADGVFVYAVTTTGVFCRPTCPSRRPQRVNVKFFPDPGAAVRAGFRTCKRCQPAGATLAQRHRAVVVAACRSIEASETLPDLARLAVNSGLSRFHFHRVFKAVTGLTPRAYAAAHRARAVRAALPERPSVTEALYEAGYGSSGRFYADSARTLGMLPKRYRDGGRGETIRFAVGDCSLGVVLAAASARGVCAILLGDDPDRLARELQDRFPRATLVGGARDFEEIVARVVALVEAPGIGLDLPLDVRGTAFQQRVWAALGDIPVGSTASYTEVAARIGRPTAVRAVARACAANALAVAIPCHRVVRHDHALSGYRWGVERKRALLRREGVAA